MTSIVTRHLIGGTAQAIAETAVAIQSGHLVVFPTDTVYGVGCNPFDEQAVARLFAVKGRPLYKGIPILLADITDLDKVAQSIPPLAQQLIDRFWPGPLTVIVPKRPELPEAISDNEGIAVRIPDNLVARAVIRAAGGAVAATSANQTGEPAAQTGQQALNALDGKVSIVLDGGPTDQSMASTVVDCMHEPFRILRSGPIVEADITLAQRYKK